MTSSGMRQFGLDPVRLRRLPAVLALLWLLPLAACGQAFTTGAASMRIEVEVYKGPLSKDVHTQWGELLGLVREANESLYEIGRAYGVAVFRIGRIEVSKDGGSANDDAVKKAFMRALDQADIEAFHKLTGLRESGHGNWQGACEAAENATLLINLWNADWGKQCTRVIGLFGSYIQLRNRLNGLAKDMCHPNDDNFSQQDPIDCPPGTTREDRKVVELLTEASEIASRASFKSFYWTAHELGDLFNTGAERVLLDSVNLFSNLSNQIGSRADRLLQQLAGTDRKHMPLSAFLRDVDPTEFTELYDTLQGHIALRDKLHDVRVLESLAADSNWANINTVYASGQGNVAMAFIKDDIGNWNLKSFDNDPTELLKAYTDFTLNAIETAAKLAASAQTGGGTQALNQALALASRASSGQIGGGGTANLDVQALHERAVAELRSLSQTVRARYATLDKASSDAAEMEKSVAKDVREAVEDAETPVDSADGDNAESLADSARDVIFEVEFEMERSGLDKTEKTKAETALGKARSNYDEARQQLQAAAKAPVSPAEGDTSESKPVLRERAARTATTAKRWADAAQAEFALALAVAVKNKAEAEEKAHLVAVAAKTREILDNHRAVLDAVETMAISRESPTAPTVPSLPLDQISGGS